MKTIELTQGKVTIVDDDVYEWASKFKWLAQKSRNTFYACRKVSLDFSRQNRITIRLHREILPLASGVRVDHRDGDGLNNLRENLRPASASQNAQNKRHQKTNTSSKFKGVSRHSRDQKWQAGVCVNGKQCYLGSFIVEEDAARAYDKAAKFFFGEYAKLNFPVCERLP